MSYGLLPRFVSYCYCGPQKNVLNIGWLAKGREFPKGEVPPGFFERLAACAVEGPIMKTARWPAAPVFTFANFASCGRP